MPMPEKKCKKTFFSEDFAATLTKRYGTTTVLTLLQELAHYPPEKKLDWNELVKKTSTGISNAREYQMLWHHIAYGNDLPEFFEEGAQPMDDDSDLDCELETLPSVSTEYASDTTAFAKVMMASRAQSESTPSSSTIEVPMIVHVPVFHSSRNLDNSSHPSNMLGTSIAFPVTVQRQTLPTISSADGIETKGLVGGSVASKRKRKAWSEEEDILLRKAVQRLGEGNWAVMAKGDTFPIKRSATQLAQRWSTLRKKDGSDTSRTVSTNPQSQYTTAEQLATRHSLSLALDMMPFKKLTSSGLNGPVRTSASIKNEVKPYNVSTVRGSVPPQRPSQQVSLTSEKTASKCNSISDPELKPTVVHSGAQTVSQSNTGSQFKVGQAKKTVDIVPVGSSLTKTSISAGLPSDQKDKHVISVVDKVAIKQEIKIPDRGLKPTVVHSGTQTVSQSSTVLQVKVAQPKATGSSLTKTPISAGLPSNQKDIHVTSKVNEVPLKRELKSTAVHSGAQPVSQSNNGSQFKASQAKNAIATVPVGSSLIKTSISAGLPPNQKDKPDTSVVDKVMLKQEVKISGRELKPTTDTVHSGTQTVSQSKTVSQFQVSQAKNAVNTVSVGSSLTKTSISAGLPLNQKVEVQKKMEHKEVSENSGGCEGQAKVTNSNVTSKTEGTENENKNLDKGNQDLDQGKGTSTINGSSDHQNMNEESVNLPKGESSRVLELQDSKN